MESPTKRRIDDRLEFQTEASVKGTNGSKKSAIVTPPDSSTFDVITKYCRQFPGRDRLTFLRDDGQIETAQGHELIGRSIKLSSGLRRVASPGDRVLLAYPAGIDFVVGFLACLHAGLIPVPVTYPKPRRSLSRYKTVAGDSQATIALTSSVMLSLIDPATLSSVRWFCEQSIPSSESVDADDVAPAVERSGDQEVFLQYTSGSTSEPKGVMVTLNNLIANLNVIGQGFQIDQLDPDKRVVCSWLPSYHDMGLVGVILSALVHDGHAVMMSPTAFLQRPARWLAAISDYRACVTVAPSFGYQWAAEKISSDEIEALGIDLTCLRVAACGAEPIHASVLERFADQFAGSGFRHEVFYPCYGLAESTLMVTGTDRGDSSDHLEQLPGPITATISRGKLANDIADEPESPDDAQTVVSCGVVAKDTQVCVVDPKTNRSLGDNRIGEIRVHSPSVAAGYWNDEDRTRKVFGESIDGDGRNFLHTGDLGFLRNGQLYVTGRIKDLIIIGGQNHYPQDIERTVAAADTMLVHSSGAAFSIQQDSGEQLVIVHEVPRSFNTDDADQIIRSVRLAIASTHDLTAQEIVLIRPASLPRTSSGKIQRNGCRQRFLEDGFESVYRWRHADQLDPELFPDIGHLIARASSRSLLRQKIEMTLLKWLQRFTDAGPVSSDQSFAELGVDSLMAVELSQQLERWLGVRLSPVAAWSYPTPAGLAEHLTALVAGQPESIADPLDPARDEFEDLLAQIDSLNEDEVDDLLRQASSQQS